MSPEQTDDRLVLIYRAEDMKPVGNGFFVTEYGHFVTAYHVVSGFRIQEELKCRWTQGNSPIRYVATLSDSGFYRSLKKGDIRIDLVMLQINLTDRDAKTPYFPVYNSNPGNRLLELGHMFWKGYDIENSETPGDARLCTGDVSVASYHEANSWWTIEGQQNIRKGFSGSPVILAPTQEAVAVLVQRDENKKKSVAIQSLHMLMNEIKSHDQDLHNRIAMSDVLYKDYLAVGGESLEKEKHGAQHEIDEELFVELFDFKKYILREAEQAVVYENDNCAAFIVEQARTHPVFCVGYYGMGKTTLSKHIFRNFSQYSNAECPVFLSLSRKRLSEISLEKLNSWLVSDIITKIRSEANPNHQFYRDRDREVLEDYVRRFLRDNDIMLILDGIDEAVHSDTSLNDFYDLVSSLPYRCIVTCRKEFYGFFDVFERSFGGREHVVVELLEWCDKQWEAYVDNLRRKFPDKSDGIKNLTEALRRDCYGELPRRPLFLRMISDLELDQEAALEIPEELKSNRSAIYHRYIEWKIGEDFDRNRKQNDNKLFFCRDSFALFRQLADVEYETSVPAGNAEDVADLSTDADTGTSDAPSGFLLSDVEKVCENLTYLRAERTQEYLLGTTFFSMLRKADDEDEFRFSHKSFCEYLRAFNLADTILGGTVEDASCDRTWDFYQTNEVSLHFLDEVERRQKTEGWDDKTRNLYFKAAFEKVISRQLDLMTYSEIVEEVLYYTGVFKIDSPHIVDVLQYIIEHPIGVHPVYYRTTHLSLSMIRSVDYCLDYIEHLVESYHGDQKAFLCNSKIQIGYYGEANLRRSLRPKIDEFIKSGKLDGILPLKIFSYFTCLPFSAAEIDGTRKYFAEIRCACEKNDHRRMFSVLDSAFAIMQEQVRLE